MPSKKKSGPGPQRNSTSSRSLKPRHFGVVLEKIETDTKLILETLSTFAAKEELREMREEMATKKELREIREVMATKKQLDEMREEMATKEELREIREVMATKKDIEKIEHVLTNHQQRLVTLETA